VTPAVSRLALVQELRARLALVGSAAECSPLRGMVPRHLFGVDAFFAKDAAPPGGDFVSAAAVRTLLERHVPGITGAARRVGRRRDLELHDAAVALIAAVEALPARKRVSTVYAPSRLIVDVVLSSQVRSDLARTLVGARMARKIRKRARPDRRRAVRPTRKRTGARRR
jgi:hypothetical protein